MAHVNIRAKKKKDSPKNLVPSLNEEEGEVGEFLEIKLFGGVVTSVRGPSDLSGGLKITKLVDDKEKHYSISDSWIRSAVRKILAGDVTADGLIPHCVKITPTKTNRTGKKRRRNEIEEETSERVHYFTRNGKDYVA